MALLCRPKHLQLLAPNIQTTLTPHDNQQVAVTLKADTAALYVWIELAGGRFSDNFFHLLPNQAQTVYITLPQGTEAAQIAVHSLFDTYQQS